MRPSVYSFGMNQDDDCAEARPEGEAFVELAEAALRVAHELNHRGRRNVGNVTLVPITGNITRYIARHPGVTPSAVAAGTGVLRSNVSVALRELERINFIRRESVGRGRSIRIFSTDAAAKYLESVRRDWVTSLSLGGSNGSDAVRATVLLEAMADSLAAARSAN